MTEQTNGMGQNGAAALYTSVADAAARLAVHEDTVYARIRDQQLAAVQVGGVFRIPHVALDHLAPAGASERTPRQEHIAGYVTCGADRATLPEDCPGYASRPASLLKRTIYFTGWDLGVPRSERAGSAVDHDVSYLHAIDPNDVNCAFCGAVNTLSEMPRPTYPRAHAVAPDEIVKRARGEAARAAQSLALQERSASAQEQMLEIQRRELDLREREIAVREAEIAALRNGHAAEPEPAPAPARRKAGSS
jgi:excisionase family DNA binding protein